MTVNEGLGQPLIDNQEGIGNAVFRETIFGPWIYGKPIGYSRNCSIKTRVDYYYFSGKHDAFLPLKNRGRVPSDIERIIVDDKEIDFIVRVERGSINRFLYSIAMLAPYPESTTRPDNLNNSAWNNRLVYKLQGGVGIGHWQGQLPMNKSQALHYQSLKRGYAVAFSSGTSSATHYNIKLAEETALMLKRHFIETYGRPDFTIGIGGSGGAIQQYMIAQNNPDLLDGIIPQLSYPDMLTQISYVADCDLLERYFDSQFKTMPDSKWGNWQFRAEIEGVSASSSTIKSSKYNNPYAPTPGGSTCSHGWRGHTQTIMNPYVSHPAYQKALTLFRYPDAVKQDIKWTHWNDLANIYPQDAHGFAMNTWDNTGVQYGLQALRNNLITTDEFLQLNACVGSWKTAAQMRLGDYPWNTNADKNKPDPWDHANMNLKPKCKFGTPAPRASATAIAIQAANDSGNLFNGNVNLPIIDVRWYLDPTLDIHHALGSFSARARIINKNGNAKNHAIWVAGCDKTDPETLDRVCSYDPTDDALDVMQQWLSTGMPITAVDSCFDAQGDLLASGLEVWNGILDDKDAGACTRQFTVHSTPRMMAGEDIKGDTLKCELKSIDSAIQDGTYHPIQLTQQQTQRLREIFPTGVCNY